MCRGDVVLIVWENVEFGRNVQYGGDSREQARAFHIFGNYLGWLGLDSPFYSVFSAVGVWDPKYSHIANFG